MRQIITCSFFPELLIYYIYRHYI